MTNPSKGETVTVRFVAPVEGVDPLDGEIVVADRHRVNAVWVRQDGAETVFVNDEGEVAALWSTTLIKQMTWAGAITVDISGPENPAPVGTREWRTEIQQRHARAYERWSQEEERQLSDAFRAGLPIAELARKHGRRTGGIVSRLVRLGLVSPDGSVIGDSESTFADQTMGSEYVAELDDSAGVVDTACRHDLTIGTCSICKNDSRPPVYISGGGIRFHSVADCAAMLEGQAQVAARGGVVDDIQRVLRGSSLLEGRSACLTCRPDGP